MEQLMSQSGNLLANAILPAERTTIWQPGLSCMGGVPRRSAIHRTLRPSGGDDTAAIQSALDSCPAEHVVQLSTGEFKISGQGLRLGRSNVTLRGNGEMTVITGACQTALITIGSTYTRQPPRDLIANGQKGEKSITVSDTSELKVGDLVTLNQLSDSEIRSDTSTPPRRVYWSPNHGVDSRNWYGENNRPIGQTLEIQSIDGLTLAFTTPLHIDFETLLGAHIFRVNPDSGTDCVKRSGVEDLCVKVGSAGNIKFSACAYCWVSHLESANSRDGSVVFDSTFRCELRDSYVYGTQDASPAGGGVGIQVQTYASDNLVENCIILAFYRLLACCASGGGNVFGYNYMQDGYRSDDKTRQVAGMGPNGWPGSHMELFEGNESFNVDTDSVHGNSIECTYFRNHLTGLRRFSKFASDLNDYSERRIVGLEQHSFWYSFVGNVLGFQDMPLFDKQTRFVYETDVDWVANHESWVPVWTLGHNTPGPGEPVAAPNPLTVARTVRIVNFDYLTNMVHTDGENVQDLTDSLYLESKPAFFGKVPWPWVHPNAESAQARVGQLPARLRFEAGDPWGAKQ
jgi:hypothetical protein